MESASLVKEALVFYLYLSRLQPSAISRFSPVIPSGRNILRSFQHAHINLT
jgi:hypothetical protein